LPESSLVALREYGTKSFREVIEPALDFADGAAIDEQRANAVYLSRDFFKLWPTSMKHFMPEGHVTPRARFSISPISRQRSEA